MSARAQSASATRLVDYLNGIKLAIDGSELFEDVRVCLDPYAVEDITKENTKLPAARIYVLRMGLEPEAISAKSLNLNIGIAVIAAREGRSDVKIASADMAAMGLVIDLAALIQADPYFGMEQVSAAQPNELRVVVSEKSNVNALAITLLQVNTKLLELLPVWPGAAAIFDATRSEGTGLTINNGAMELVP